MTKDLSTSKSISSDARYWSRLIESDRKIVCFGTGLRLGGSYDLASYARSLPEGIVLCDPKLIAGTEHLEAVLLQTAEYWKRNQRLVRNGSIEILMRLACKSQITEAVKASNISDTDKVALVGLASSQKQVEKLIQDLLSEYVSAKIDPDLLRLGVGKARSLKKLHGLPSWLTNGQLQTALQEKSVLLIFSK